MIKKPWGYYVVLDEGENYKTKKLCVHPGQSISLQYHELRSEYWVVTNGYAVLNLESEEVILYPGKSCKIANRKKHKVVNNGDHDLIIIETQIGICDENDIVRLQDDYGRS